MSTLRLGTASEDEVPLMRVLERKPTACISAADVFRGPSACVRLDGRSEVGQAAGAQPLLPSPVVRPGGET
jgi:hypothetical protein